MKNAAFELCKAKYEEVYKTKLFYTCDEKNALDGKEKGVAIQRIERSIFDEGVLVRCDA